MQKRKLQVFVSSTYLDLKEERQTAVQAILSAGHIPAGMELFTAGDESQWNIIKEWIDESDVYMLIVGARYGSVEPKSGKSYTQLEYDYAVEKGKPLFALVLNDKFIDEKVTKQTRQVVLEQNNEAKLREFKSLVTSKMCAFCEDEKDIKLQTILSLNNFEKRPNIIGWVRATDTNYGEIAEQLAKLAKENEELKTKTELASKVLINGIDVVKMKEILENEKLMLDDKFESYKERVLSNDLFHTYIYLYRYFGNLYELQEFIGGPLKSSFEDAIKRFCDFNLIKRQENTRIYNATDEGAKFYTWICTKVNINEIPKPHAINKSFSIHN